MTASSPSSSSSSQKAKKVVVALLALWSIVSLVVIVVWATSPDLKSSSQCRAELKETAVKLEGSKVVCAKDREALEELVREAREERDGHKARALLLLGQLDAANASLQEAQQENRLLLLNVSSLQEELDSLRLVEQNLTAELLLKDDHIEALQQNLTQAEHDAESCSSLRVAAENQMLAAQTQTRACESMKTYLKKQLLKCKVVESTASPQQSQQKPTPSSLAPPPAGFPAMALLACGALLLLTTCE